MLIFDTEVYRNVFLIGTKNVWTGKKYHIWGHDENARDKVRQLMKSGHTFVGFNSLRYDDLIINAFLSGYNEARLKELSDEIIQRKLAPWKFYRDLGAPQLKYDHIDLIEVAPSFVSLKAYAARMHMPWLKSLPYHHDKTLTPDEMDILLIYNLNDLDVTEELYNRLTPAIELRNEMSAIYQIDMRSKSDTQMAEAAFVKRLNLERPNAVPRTITYNAPSYIKFKNPFMSELVHKLNNTQYLMNRKSGHVELPELLKKPVEFYGGIYKMGVGGIHSQHDKAVCHVAGKDNLMEVDAQSFYPNIMINRETLPERLGARFIEEYRNIYQRRLKAKAEGKTREDAVLKISINGTFGKTASRWSPLYSPDMMLYTTVTGQLTLLMLIEWLHYAGVKTLSANTDGILIKYPDSKADLVKQVVSRYEEVSNFVFEFTRYRAIAMANCNNYIAVKADKSTKRKGIYAELALNKNPTAEVCSNAVAEWLANGTPIKDTILSAPFVDFLSARTANGGARQGDEYLGPVVRWYYTTEQLPPITYISSGNKVAKSDGARACMLIEDKVKHPEDLDYEWYFNEAKLIAERLGAGEYL